MADSKSDQREGTSKPKNVWHRHAPTWHLGDEAFKFVMPRGLARRWNITKLVESCTWEDVEAVMTGSLALRWPDDRKLKIEENDEIRCLMARRPGGDYKEVWSMRVVEPTYDLAEGAFSCTLENDLATLRKSKDDFRYVQGEHKHKEGWKAHQITEDILQRYRIPAKIAKTRHVNKKVEKRNTSPLEVINEVYKTEREHTGRRFVIKFKNGKLVIRPLRRNKYLSLMKRQIIAATYSQSRGKDFATVLTVRGSGDDKKEDDKRKKKGIKLKVRARRRIKRFGYIHQFENGKNLDSNREARKFGRRKLARRAKLKNNISVSHIGIPFIERGDAVRVDLSKVPHFSKPRIVFVVEAHHSIALGEYTMELILNEDDLYRDQKKERECLKKCKKAAENGDKPPKDCDCPGWIEFDKESDKSDKNRQRS